MIDSDKILSLIRSRGLVVPTQLASEVKVDSMIMGAVLSSLVKSGKLSISHAKIGGSHAYYLKEQESKLQELYRYLNEKDKRTYDLLKERKVLRDREQTPLVRVSLTNIKDFAKSFEVETSGAKEMYWRWYLIPQSDAIQIAQQTLSPTTQQTKKEPPAAPVQPIKHQPVAMAVVGSQKPEIPLAQETKPEKKDTSIGDDEPIQKEALPEQKQEKTIHEKPGFGNKEVVQQELMQGREPTGDILHEKTKRFFNEAGIIVRSVEVIKRNAELDYVIDVPSAVGMIAYYCKSKAKRRSTEGDLAAAFVRGQNRKLPVLYLTTGEITKKAKDMLKTDFHTMKAIEVKL
jgi:hypothetical protein